MSTINPIFQVSKGLAKTALKQGVHADAANSVKAAFAGIQRDIFSFSHEVGQANQAVNRAADELSRATEQSFNAATRPADWRESIDAYEQKLNIANQILDQYAENAPEMAMKESGLRQITLKQKGRGGNGKEYAQVRSHSINGQKHASLKVNLPARGSLTPDQYAQETTAFAGDFVETLQHRSQFVSPYLATFGRDHWASLQRYQNAMEAFHTPNATGAVNAQIAENLLKNSRVQAKVMQDGRFRIKLQNREDVGRLSYKLPQRANQPIGTHIDNGVQLANRVSRALDFNTNPAEQAIKDNISTRFIRDNFMSKKVDMTRLKQMEEAKQTLVSQQPRIQALAQDNVFIKILRDGSFRITRKNAQGVIAQTKTRPFNQGDIAQHIRDGLNAAENFTQDVEDKLFSRAQKRYPLTKAEEMHEDGTLMNKVSTTRKLRNKSHSMKKAFLNFVG